MSTVVINSYICTNNAATFCTLRFLFWNVNEVANSLFKHIYYNIRCMKLFINRNPSYTEHLRQHRIYPTYRQGEKKNPSARSKGTEQCLIISRKAH